MQLVLFVENEFSLTIADEDLEMANFRTVSAIEAFVERKRSIAVGS
jgi:acyl carrier protein